MNQNQYDRVLNATKSSPTKIRGGSYGTTVLEGKWAPRPNAGGVCPIGALIMGLDGTDESQAITASELLSCSKRNVVDFTYGFDDGPEGCAYTNEWYEAGKRMRAELLP